MAVLSYLMIDYFWIVLSIQYMRLSMESHDRYSGNYTSFVEQKKAAWDKQEKDYQAQQKEIARLMEIVEKFKNKPTKVAMTTLKAKTD